MSIDKIVLCNANNALDRGRVLPEQTSRKIRGRCDETVAGDTGSASETGSVPSGRAGVKLDGAGVGVVSIVDVPHWSLSEACGSSPICSSKGAGGKMPSTPLVIGSIVC